MVTLVVAQLVTVWVIFILNWSQPEPVYATYTGHYWAGVQEPPAQDFIGTEGNNQAQNAAVRGWSAPKQFVYTEDAGVGSVQEFSTLSVGTNYNFRTVKLSGTNTRGFYRDSNLITTKSLPNLSSGVMQGRCKSGMRLVTTRTSVNGGPLRELPQVDGLAGLTCNSTWTTTLTIASTSYQMFGSRPRGLAIQTASK